MAFEAERASMVRTQIEARGVRDARVLDAMRRVERHLFVPQALQLSAYDDVALAIAEGQTISQPYMVATMTEALSLEGGERVLEVGTGSGYQAAILGELAREVITIERLPDLAESAARRLAELGYRNIRVVVADGTKGFEPESPYDAVLVTAGAPGIPAPLLEQLADGGRLVIPVGSTYAQDVKVVVREGQRFSESVREPCVFVPLVGEHGWRS